jgi:cyclin B
MDRRPASASSASLQLANTLGAQAQAAAARLQQQQQQQFSMPTAQPVCAPQEAEAIVLDEVVTEAVRVTADTAGVVVAATTVDVASTAAVVAASTAVDLTATAMELCSSPAPEEVSAASAASENANTIHNENVSMAAPTSSPTTVTSASTALAVEADQYAPDSHLWSTRYAAEIVSHWFEAELRHAARADYMSVQPDLNGKMREILVDWLHEVVSRFRLQAETLFLAVNVLDRFLSLRAVNRKKLQLVGCVALLLACKYEEIYSPEIKDFLIISDNAYAREHVLHMEGVMLNALSFRLTHVSPLRFLQRFMHLPSVGWMAPASAEDACAQQLCLYLLELTLQFVDFLQFRPSTIAASVLFLVRAHCHQVLAGAGPAAAASLSAAGEASFAWGGELERETRLQARDLLPCTQVLYAHWSALNQAGSVALAASQQAAAAAAAAGLPPPAQAPAVAGNKCLAVYRKYTKERHCMVSQIKLLPPPKME